MLEVFMNENYVIATVKSWNIDAYHNVIANYPGNWTLISDKDELTLEKLRSLNPKKIFFPHWSWIIPEEILNEFTCVCIHMTDLPYGRGGSPLQNLIANGHKETRVSALKMTKELDAGPIYHKLPLDLSGSAKDIFIKLSFVATELIKYIIENDPEPMEQEGEVVHFKRRTPEDSEIDFTKSPESIYDLIRMLDAETYPTAFYKAGDKKLLFRNAQLKDGKLTADIEIE